MDSIDNRQIVEALTYYLGFEFDSLTSEESDYQVVERLQTTLKRYGYKISKED